MFIVYSCMFASCHLKLPNEDLFFFLFFSQHWTECFQNKTYRTTVDKNIVCMHVFQIKHECFPLITRIIITSAEIANCGLLHS